MPTLEFKGKPHIYAHHLTVPYRPLEPDPAKSVGEPSTDGNLIIHGDNLHALKALLPRYAGRVKCIYIDPPYNTGRENWTFNDNVNSRLMQDWFKSQAPIDGEDLERHDKWLCMMWPRLQILRDLLANDGVIFISIDHNEKHRLQVALDEVFGHENFIVEIAWKKRSTPPPDKVIAFDHEYIISYSKCSEDVHLSLRPRTEEQRSRYRNPDNHPNGPWISDNLMANTKGGRYVKSLHFPIINPQTKEEHWPGERGNWRFSKERIGQLLSNDEIWFGKNGKGRPKLKRFFADVKDGVTYPSIWDFTPLNTAGSSEMRAIFGDITTFENPKPEGLIRELLRLGGDPNAIVLDSFAGSGTTAQAVLALNKEDGGNRKFILVECEDYADTITAERVRRVIAGVPDAKDESLREGLGGAFTYCELGDPIGVEGMLTGEALPSFPTLAAWLLHTATGVSAGATQLQSMDEDGRFYSDEERDYFLLYEPSIDWLRSEAGVLNEERARRIGEKRSKEAIVFGAAKYISQQDLTAEYRITFCQLPYEIHRRQ